MWNSRRFPSLPMAGENAPETQDRDSKLLSGVLCRGNGAAFTLLGLGCILKALFASTAFTRSCGLKEQTSGG